MKRWRSWTTGRRPVVIWRDATLVIVVALLGSFLVAQETALRPAQATLLATAPEPVYSNDPNDPWNRIFYFLFSRRIETRVSEEFPEGAPFVNGVSTRTFQRNEVGDRAIDPLYPSQIVDTGRRLVLTEPGYSDFTKALDEALDSTVFRATIARALMQSDLWGAHDILSVPFFAANENELGERRLSTLDLISRLIRKIALTPAEIRSLPNNYSGAVRSHSFPDVFAKDSGWIEVLWFHPRTHDSVAGFRRTSRVFLKPTQVQRDMKGFLGSLPERAENDPIGGLDGVALVTQFLLIDTEGKLEPTSLTSEVQIRMFENSGESRFKTNDGTFKTNGGTFKRTSMQVCEISRKLFMRGPESGGLVPEEDRMPAYDQGYGFGEGQFVNQGANASIVVEPPIQVTLRTRCSKCHGDTLTQITTFAIARPPHNVPPVRQLNPAAAETANFVIAQKMRRRDFEALRAYFNDAGGAATRH
jgi:hypothetical protein